MKNHLLLNFTDMSEFADQDVRVFVRGDGCHVIDADGRRAIDGISGLFCTNLGHGYGAEIGRPHSGSSPSSRSRRRGSSRIRPRRPWPSGWPSSPARSALTRVFLTSGGGEANEAAWKLARQWHAANGQPQRRKAISRRLAYHGTSLGALSFTGLPVRPAPVRAAADPDRFREQHQCLSAPARP